MNTQQEVPASPSAKESKKRRPPAHDWLKAERVQDGLMAEEALERLRDMPGWRLVQNGGAIRRVFNFPKARIAALFSSFVLEFAGTLGQPLTLQVAGRRTAVTLHGPRQPEQPRVLTESVLAFAVHLG